MNPFVKESKIKTLNNIKMDFDLTAKMDFSDKMLSDNSTFLSTLSTTLYGFSQIFGAYDEIFDELKQKHDFFKPGQKFDIVVIYAMLTNEIGYYLAHRFDSTLILYSAVQASTINIDWALGQPHNPAVLPFIGAPYKHPMTFFQRVLNTLIHGVYILGKLLQLKTPLLSHELLM